MAQPDLEDVIDKWMSLFQAQFAANLAAVDARKATPLSPEAPVQWIFGDKENLPQMPCMLFTGHQTKEDEDEIGWRRQTYPLEIEAYYQGSDVEQLSRIMRRYGAAVDDTLRATANQRVSGFWQGVTNISQMYWDAMDAKNGGLFQSVRVTFDVIVATD